MEIKNKILTKENTEQIINQLKQQNKKIGFCSGCFDVLHSGHAVFFQQCKKFADILILALGTDKIVKQLKGKNRPINPENNRLFLLSAMQDVDYVILSDEPLLPGKIHYKKLLEKIKPDFFILNDDDSAIKEKQQLCNELDINLELVPRTVPDFLTPTSSSEISKKIIS